MLELEQELLRQDPLGGPVTDLALAMATATLNSCIRSRGLSAREIWTQRDQFSNKQIPFSDYDLTVEQHRQRQVNHPQSKKSKALTTYFRQSGPVEVGDLVYLYPDHNKTRARDRYLVISTDGAFVT